MYFDRPHDVTKYYSSLEPEVGKRIFVQGQSPLAYQAAAYASFRLESLFRSKALAAEFKPLRHHLLMGIRVSAIPGKVELQDKGFVKRLNDLLALLDDPPASLATFKGLADRADRLKAESNSENLRQLAKSVALRELLRVPAP